MKEKRKSKKWYNNIWIWLIVLGAVLCVVNIVLACIFRKEGPNIFTAISGWVSGIATVILGIVAIEQNRKYKLENDRYLTEQQKISDFNIKEQKDLAWRNAQYQLFKFYVDTLCETRNSLNENYFSLIHNDIVALPINEESYVKFIFRKNLLTKKLKELRDFLVQSQYLLADKEKLYDATSNHLDKVTNYFKFIIKEKYYNIAQALKSKNDSALLDEVKSIADASYSTWTLLSNELMNHINKLYELMAGLNNEDSTVIKDKINNSITNYAKWKKDLIDKKDGDKNND